MNKRSSFSALGLAVLISLMLLGSCPAHGQLFWPENLGSGVNTDYSEVNPVFSHGGDTLFFSRINSNANRYGSDSQDIWMSVKGADGKWGEAQRLPNSVNITRYNALYSALSDGKTFLIGGVFDKEGTIWLRRGFSFIRHENGQWGKPERIHVNWAYWMNEGDVANASMSPDGEYLYLAMSRWYGGKNLSLYVSRRTKDKHYSRPRRLRGPMERFLSVEAPSYSVSDGRLYYAAMNRKGRVSDMNIYSAGVVGNNPKRVNWGRQEKLSDTVNSANWDSYFTVHPNGKVAFMCSTKDGYGKSDIFSVQLVEPRPWVKVTGRILDANTGRALPVSAKAVLVVDSVSNHDSMRMVGDSARFEGLLPLGHKYMLTARRPHYTSDTVFVDVSQERRYQEQDVQLTLTSVPYMLIKGKMINTVAMQPIESRYKPIVLIDGKPVDSMVVDPAAGTYSVKLPFGRKYQITARATEHTPKPSELDLTKYREYGELDVNAFAMLQNANMVTLKGTVINTKTGKPLEPGIDVKMRVNRVLSDMFKYDDKTAGYTLMLPAGSDYDLTPSVKNFYNKLEVIDLRTAKARSVVQRNFFVMPLEVGQSVDIENIFFETGKSKLKPESYRSLNALVEFFNEYPNVVVEVGGHTDNVGTAAINRRLSAARAQAVADYIIEQGIGKDRFRIKGYGPDKPKASNKTAKGRAQNRRVDFTIVGI